MPPKNAYFVKYDICRKIIQTQWDIRTHLKTEYSLKKKNSWTIKNLQRYASVDKYDALHGGLTSLHFKEKCSCIAAPKVLYSVQYPVDKQKEIDILCNKQWKE